MYKVIRRSGDIIHSISTSGLYRLQYKLNEWTEPKIGKIFVFKEKEDAIWFQLLGSPCSYSEIYKCEAENAEPMERCAMCIEPSITKFWKGKTKPYHDQKTPKGTYGADRIKLLEKI